MKNNLVMMIKNDLLYILYINMNSIQKLPIVKSDIISGIKIKLLNFKAENIKLIDFESNKLYHYLLLIEFIFVISLLDNELQQYNNQSIRINQNNYKDYIYVDELETKFVMKEFLSKKNIKIAINFYLNDFGEHFDTQIVLKQNLFSSALELLIILIQSNIIQSQTDFSNLKIIDIIYSQINTYIQLNQNVEFYDINAEGQLITLYKTIPIDIPTLQIENLVPSDKNFIKLSDIAKLTKDTPKITIGTGKPNVIYQRFNTQVVPQPVTQSVSKPVTPLLSKPVTPLVSKPVTPSVYKPVTPIQTQKVVNKPVKPLITKSISKTISSKINEYIVISSNIEEYSLGIDYNTIWVFPPKISVQVITDIFKIENLKTFIAEIDKRKFEPIQSCFGLRVNTHYPIELMGINHIQYKRYTKIEEPILKKNTKELYFTNRNKLDFNELLPKILFNEISNPIEIRIISTDPNNIINTNLFIVNHPKFNINGFYCGCKLKDIQNSNVQKFLKFMEVNKYNIYNKLYTERIRIIQGIIDFEYNQILPYIELFIVKSDTGFNLKLDVFNNEEQEMVQNYKLNVNKYPNKSIKELIPNLLDRYMPIKDIKVSDIIKVFIDIEKITNYLIENLNDIIEFNIIEFLILYQLINI